MAVLVTLNIYCAVKKRKLNFTLGQLRGMLATEQQQLNLLNTQRLSIKAEIQTLTQEQEQRQKQLLELSEMLADNNEKTTRAYQAYAEVLEESYCNTEKEYDMKIQLLKDTYLTSAQQVQDEIDKEKQALDSLLQTYRLSQETLKKELQKKNQEQQYCISIPESDRLDIIKLNQMKSNLSQPRILSMLIWQTYVQKRLKKLIVETLGAGEVVGIYKITNIQTSQIYIGQSTNISKRWTEHAKCGLGIDTPAQNKLYQAMQEYGIWSFSWELVEKCSREELNAKERYYIDLFDSVNYGYNTLKGNKT